MRQINSAWNGNLRFSYTSNLPRHLRNSNHSLIVTDSGEKVKVALYCGRKQVGNAHAYIVVGNFGNGIHSAWEPHSSINWEYQGRGLGKILYKTLISHLRDHLGYKLLVGMRHTAAAHRVHKALRRDCDLKYNCRRLKKPDIISGFKCTYSQYRVRID